MKVSYDPDAIHTNLPTRRTWAILLFLATVIFLLAWGGKAIYAAGQRDVLNNTTTCQYEDGDPSGRPCIWTDPDTGDLYMNDSSNYR